MLSMTEKTLVGLVVTLGVVFTVSLILPVWTYEARLSTSSSSRNISAPQGRSFNVTCQGDSNVNGQFKNMKWLNPRGEEVSKGVKEVGKNRLLLTIEDPKKSDSGVYKCLALYENKNMEIHVSVRFYGPSPEFESNYEAVLAVEGDTVDLWCQATSEEPITYEWLDQNEEKISPDSNSSMHISSSVNGSVLIIDKIQLDHGGVYMCTASNTYGMANKLYELTVRSSDGNDTVLIRNIRATKITATSVKFSLSTSQPASEIDVKYVESRDSQEIYGTFKKDADYEIHGLIPGGNYSFQFSVPTSPTSNSGWTDKYYVTLLPPKPDVIFQSLAGDSIKIQWMRMVDDIMRGTTDKFQLRYYTMQMIRGNSWKASSCAITVELPSCAGSSYTIAGLSRNIYYEIEMRAHTVSGFGEAFINKIYLSN